MKSKDLKMGKEIKRSKNDKMKNIEYLTLLAVLQVIFRYYNTNTYALIIATT